MKVGILGGTFNPIHNGHLYMGKCALDELGLDKILFIPTGVSYLKDQNQILPKEVRFHMVSLCCESDARMEVSDIEINRDGNTYTYETLLALKEMHPDWDMYFIIGADTAYMIESWIKPEIIMKLASLIILYRQGQSLEDLFSQCKHLEEKYRAKCILLKSQAINVSSTEIREKLKVGEDVSKLLPEVLYKFILDNHYYM